MRVAFMGTPEFAVPSLEMLLSMPEVEVVGVFTQPDRPSGRGHKLEKPPVKLLAEEHGVPVFQFEKIRRQEGLDALRSVKPDLCVTAAFGQILSKKILEVPRLGTINVHASLLPRHRGSAPVNWCIIQGEKVSGVTTMLTDVGLDTGDMLLKQEVEILPEETAGELTGRLAIVGAELLKQTILQYAEGKLSPIPQDEALSSYEPMLTKELGEVDFSKSAEEIDCLVRGVDPWPGAYSYLNGETLKLWKVTPRAWEGTEANGSVLKASAREGLLVKCEGGALELEVIQLPGGKRMSAKSYLAGRSIEMGTVLGKQHEN